MRQKSQKSQKRQCERCGALYRTSSIFATRHCKEDSRRTIPVLKAPKRAKRLKKSTLRKQKLELIVNPDFEACVREIDRYESIH